VGLFSLHEDLFPPFHLNEGHGNEGPLSLSWLQDSSLFWSGPSLLMGLFSPPGRLKLSDLFSGKTFSPSPQWGNVKSFPALYNKFFLLFFSAFFCAFVFFGNLACKRHLLNGTPTPLYAPVPLRFWPPPLSFLIYVPQKERNSWFFASNGEPLFFIMSLESFLLFLWNPETFPTYYLISKSLSFSPAKWNCCPR